MRALKMERLSIFLERIFNHLSKVAILLLFITMLIEVIFRYIPGLHMAQPWVPGFLNLINVWLIYLGSVVAMKSNTHLRITFLTGRMSPKTKAWNDLIVNLMSLLLMILIIYYSVPIVETGMNLTFFGGLALSKGYSFIALPVCLTAMALMLMHRIVVSVRKIWAGEFQ
jgi:TRAP-type C4-dicarboxylate transport system permease small subunit